MYAEFNMIKSAVSVFNALSKPTTLHWNLVIKANVDSGHFDDALAIYSQMREASVSPDNFTFPVINRAISMSRNRFADGESIHCLANRMGFGWNIYFCNTLIEMYGKYGCIDSTRRVFDEMSVRDLVSWTSIISVYVRNGIIIDSFKLFSEMRMADFEPNSVTMVIMLQACLLTENLFQGKQLHSYVIKKGCESHISVRNSILTVYNKMGGFEDVELFFKRIEERDVVSWNIMISRFSLKGDALKVAKSFDEMRIELIPTLETLTLVISVFAKSRDLFRGKRIHGYAVINGLSDVFFQTSLVDFYAKCGELAVSTRLFEELLEKTSISWSVMLSGFVENGFFKEAIGLFRRMQIADLKPGADIFRSLVLASGHSGALQLGKGVHGYVIKNGCYGVGDGNTSMETSILTMYSNCGDLVSARMCFDQMGIKDVIAWTSMIDSYGIHGLGSEALELLYHMEQEGFKPNSITFLSLLSACSHSGLVNEGCEVFDYMTQKFGIKPDLTHYTCLVDLLGRSGKLQEALRIIENMAVEPDSRIWGALLASCRAYSNSKLGIYAAQQVFDLEPENVGYQIVLCNIYAGGERWDEAENFRKVMSEKDLKKKPGWSCIETRGELHGFVAADRSHSQANEIYGILGSLTRHTQEGMADMIVD